MTTQDANDMLVIARTDEGFRVYSPADPAKSYIVSGSPKAPVCTCAEFQYHEGDPNWRCRHIRAVLAQLNPGLGERSADPDEAAERAAIQAEGSARPEQAARSEPARNGVSQMLIKRSVSPDGRIDALSVEFSCPLGNDSAEAVKEQALLTLKLSDEIVASFLEVNGKPGGQPAGPQSQSDGSVAARMLSIGGVNTRWGRRLYIAFEANGEKLKLFGSRKRLADALVEAGYPQAAEKIDEGTELNLPCRVTTRPSEDGKYTNVERVLPARGGGR